MAGASIAHCHVRDATGLPTSDPARFALLMQGIQQSSPGIIIQLSTGGRSGAGLARAGMLPLRPDMASPSVGSNNVPTRVSENAPDLVDWLASEMRSHNVKPQIAAFDLSHIHKAHDMWHKGQIAALPNVQFEMGVKTPCPPTVTCSTTISTPSTVCLNPMPRGAPPDSARRKFC